MPLYKLTLLPGDIQWTPEATHVCDADGYANIVNSPCTLEFDTLDKYTHVYEYISNERIQRNACLWDASQPVSSQSNVELWVTPNPDYVLPSIRKNTFLVPHPTWSNVYMPKASQCTCANTRAITQEDDLRFDAPWVTQQRPKTVLKEVVTTNKLFTTSNVEDVVYDAEQDKYILKTSEVQYPILETVDVYDDAGNIVFQKEVQKTERVVNTVEEPVLDPTTGTPVLEDVLNPVTGQPVLIPSRPEKYFDPTHNPPHEIDHATFLATTQPGAIKAVSVQCAMVMF